MENRRPPRFNSSGRKPYFDQGGSAPYRGGTPASDGRGTSPKRPARSGEGRDPGERSRGPGRVDGKRFGQNRFDGRKGDNRARPSGPAKRGPVEGEIKITSDAQITDGKLRGKTLLNSVSPHAVPTTRRLREIAFKTISRRVKAARVLDLGAGSGTIGLEAISRGAMLATFIERSARTCTVLRRNLSEMGIKDGHGQVFEEEIIPFLKKASRRKRSWDIVYFDLPAGNEHSAILDHLSRSSTIKTGGLLLMQHPSAETYPDIISSLKRWRTIDQGETILSIYERM